MTSGTEADSGQQVQACFFSRGTKSWSDQPGPEGITLFSCSTQLSTKFQLLMKTKIPANEEVCCFEFLRCCIIMLINDKMPIIVGILTFMSRINFVLS